MAAANGASKAGQSSASASLELRSNIYQTTAKASREVSASDVQALANSASQSGVPNGLGGFTTSASYSCDTCGVDCTAVRYHSLKVKGFELCQTCYLEGRFPSSMFSGDFVKLTASQSSYAQGNGDDDWSDQEILLLLEGVEMYDDDWSAIEEHVGTRSAQQCIRKFLELPIEDPYLAAESESAQGPLRYARLPFEQADNPVMSVVAFLAGVVGPGVAAEAAKTALHELTDGGAEGEKKEGSTEKADVPEEAVKDNTDGDETMDSAEKEPKEASTVEPDASSKNGDDSMAVDTPTSSSKKPSIPHSKVQRAASLALKASARAARSLADVEEQSIRSTLAQLIKLTLSKLELKMSQFEEMESLLEEERRNLESQRLALANERMGIRKMMESVRAELAKNGGTSTAGGAIAAALDSTTPGQGTKATEVQGDISMGAETGPSSEGNFATLG